jgi:hypothetical protein
MASSGKQVSQRERERERGYWNERDSPEIVEGRGIAEQGQDAHNMCVHTHAYSCAYADIHTHMRICKYC